jgi:hypothetical protein
MHIGLRTISIPLIDGHISALSIRIHLFPGLLIQHSESLAEKWIKVRMV